MFQVIWWTSGDVLSRKHAGLKIYDILVESSDTFLEILQCLINDHICTDFLGNLFRIATMRNKFFCICQINPVNMRKSNWWCTRGEIDFPCSFLSCHLNNFSRGRTPYDRIIDEQYVFPKKF